MKDVYADIKQLMEAKFREVPEKIVALGGSGSDRKYYRVYVTCDEGPKSVIATEGTNVEENRCFCNLSRIFRENGIRVPEVYDISESGEIYLQEDLGTESLLDVIKSGEKDRVERLLSETVRQLVAMQTIPKREWEGNVKERPFGHRLIFRDLNYFKYDFLKPIHIEYDEDALEDDFEKLSERLQKIPYDFWGFMMRDCQSRNVMIKDKSPYFIDFQGGLYGPGIYDIVSLLWQAKAGFGEEIKLRMVRLFAEELERKTGIKVERTERALQEVVLFRLLQVMGAYGFRGLIEKKAHFLESIDAGISNLADFRLKGGMDDYPELDRITCRLNEYLMSRRVTHDKLCVSVISFSYKKGYPEDVTGNGGGFMFDCRSIHNPGRYDEYKHLTGLDEPVIEFLESCGEVQPFLKNAGQLVLTAVGVYLRRGFVSLQVGFGCTGGQHRSVYCAEKMARVIKEMYAEADVLVIHREQNIEKKL